MKKTLIITGIALVFVAIVLYFMYRNRKSNSLTPILTGTGNELTGEDGFQASNMLEAYTRLQNASFPLQAGMPYGSYGREVMILQAYINRSLNGKLKLDGKFGPATLAAVKENFINIETREPMTQISREFYDIYLEPAEAVLKDYLKTITK